MLCFVNANGISNDFAAASGSSATNYLARNTPELMPTVFEIARIGVLFAGNVIISIPTFMPG
jgi:hypothetical protein